MPDRCIDHSRQPDVACEKETAIDLCRKVEAGESRGKFGFGRRGIFGGAFDLHRGRFGRIELRCIDHQIAECKLLVAMADEAANNFAFLPVDIPSRCRCHGEQGPCGGSSFAQGWLVSCQTSAICRGDEGVAAGEVFRQPTARIIGKTRQIGPERRPFRSERNIRVKAGRRRGLDGNLSPVRAKLDGHDLCKQGCDPLPHLQLGNGHRHHAIAADGDPAAEFALVRSGR